MAKVIKLKGFKELRRAINQQPQVVVSEARNYFIRSLIELKKIVRRNPWRVGKRGGGVPVDTGHLRDYGHYTRIEPMRAVYGVDNKIVNYARYIHEGTSPHTIRAKTKSVLANKKTGQIFGKEVKHPGMKARPWLDYALEKSKPKIRILQDQLAENIIKSLAR